MRPYATSVRGLKLLVYEALSAWQAALGIIILQLLLGALSETQEVDANTGLSVPLPQPPSIEV